MRASLELIAEAELFGSDSENQAPTGLPKETPFTPDGSSPETTPVVREQKRSRSWDGKGEPTHKRARLDSNLMSPLPQVDCSLMCLVPKAILSIEDLAYLAMSSDDALDVDVSEDDPIGTTVPKSKRRNSIDSFIVDDALSLDDSHPSDSRLSTDQLILASDMSTFDAPQSERLTPVPSSVNTGHASHLATPLRRTKDSSDTEATCSEDECSSETHSGHTSSVGASESCDDETKRSMLYSLLKPFDIESRHPLLYEYLYLRKPDDRTDRMMAKFRTKHRETFAQELMTLFSEVIFRPCFSDLVNDPVANASSHDEGYTEGFRCWNSEKSSTERAFLPIVWKPRLTNCAGKFRSCKRRIDEGIYNKYIHKSKSNRSSSSSGNSGGVVSPPHEGGNATPDVTSAMSVYSGDTTYARGWIELSPKILDTPERIAGTLLHEMCHAAQKLIDEDVLGQMPENPHGPRFKAWTKRCSGFFPSLKSGLSTYHNYKSFKPYQWRCEKCGILTSRHSKSLKVARIVCAAKDEATGVLHPKTGNMICMGKFIYLGKFDRNNKCITPGRRGLSADEIKGGTIDLTLATISPYRAFQRATIAELKKTQPGMSFRDMTRELSTLWNQHKQSLDNA